MKTAESCLDWFQVLACWFSLFSDRYPAAGNDLEQPLALSDPRLTKSFGLISQCFLLQRAHGVRTKAQCSESLLVQILDAVNFLKIEKRKAITLF